MPSSTDIIQATSAVVTTILAFVTFWQGRKINTLTDVVQELKAQTKVLYDNYQMEFQCNRINLMPVFVLQNKILKHQPLFKRFQFQLLNEGKTAHEVKVISHNPTRVALNLSRENELVVFNGVVDNLEFFYVNAKIPDEKQEFTGEITYETADNNFFSQGFTCTNGKLTLHKQRLINREKAELLKQQVFHNVATTLPEEPL